MVILTNFSVEELNNGYWGQSEMAVVYRAKNPPPILKEKRVFSYFFI
jgi:hypothetical protein